MITIAIVFSSVLLTSMIAISTEQANSALKNKLKEKVDKFKDKISDAK